MKKKVSDGIVTWENTKEEGFYVYVCIDRTTKLTAGSKVLYPGK